MKFTLQWPFLRYAGKCFPTLQAEGIYKFGSDMFGFSSILDQNLVIPDLDHYQSRTLRVARVNSRVFEFILRIAALKKETESENEAAKTIRIISSPR
ncbi:hypothetical protein MRB53_000366 [Persea americana]|uniref:Uncharacterized protein n=1 Tax=Persea americana TaxID=3435 RepID=A0ACC2MPF9_PERAE|nr:hypothetical protein MRB53_000366 [Persea americana]